jgi:ubiquinol-cytochrome c reductase cytochrome b subunit
MKIAFWLFVFNFFILMRICAKHPATPSIEKWQISTVLYFSWLLIIVPFIGLAENT